MVATEQTTRSVESNLKFILEKQFQITNQFSQSNIFHFFLFLLNQIIHQFG